MINDEKWANLIEMAKADFENVSYYTEDMLVEVRDNQFKDGTQDILEFTNSKGTFKVMRQNRLQYGPKVRFFKEMYGEWEELNPENIAEIF